MVSQKVECFLSDLQSAVYIYIIIYTSDMQGLVWGEPELAHEYDFDVENIEWEV